MELTIYPNRFSMSINWRSIINPNQARKGILFLFVHYSISAILVLYLSACHSRLEPKQAASSIRLHYQQHIYTLKPKHFAHFGVRQGRQYRQNLYPSALYIDLSRAASRLNRFAARFDNRQQIVEAGRLEATRLAKKSGRRYELLWQGVKGNEEFLIVFGDLVRDLAKIDEYGLKIRQDSKIRSLLNHFDFGRYVNNRMLIRAKAAQMANQVFWLRQLKLQDHVAQFLAAMQRIYPPETDDHLDAAEFNNKLYGLTHIIIADSYYYRHLVKAKKYKWIYDYFRQNLENILKRAKTDVILEIGISFRLAFDDNNQETNKALRRIESHILQILSRHSGLLPDMSGQVDLNQAEHRHVLAILFLDWQGAHDFPNADRQPELFASLPWGLVIK